MAATSVITCPNCTRKFKGREELVGRKVRCPNCGHSFIVQELAKDKVDSEEELAAREAVAALTGKPSAAGKPAPPAEPAQPAALPPKLPHDDLFDEDGNPYGVTTLDLSPRCPNCANELTSADALICLHCGYNTQTRKIATTKKIIEHTGGERFVWLLPGLLCALGVFILFAMQMFYCFALPDIIDKDSWVNMFNHESMRLWIGLILLGFMWGLAYFAHKRLIFQPTPPEKTMD
jgi:DNA-directed RNA polymerase subunit RPC12/RpoP